MDNNVHVIRCKETGEAVLVDAANEHELLLEMCQELGVRQVVETHGHWDHIQAVPAVRDAGYAVSVSAADAGMLPSYDLLLEDGAVLEVGRLRLETIANPGHTPGSVSLLPPRHAAALQRRHPLPRWARATRSSRARTSTPSSARSRSGSSAGSGPRRSCSRATATDTTIGTESPHLQEWIDRGW